MFSRSRRLDLSFEKINSVIKSLIIFVFIFLTTIFNNIFFKKKFLIQTALLVETQRLLEP